MFHRIFICEDDPIQLLSLKQYVLLCERAEAISKQLAAWDKYLTKNAVVRRDGGESNDL